MWYSLQLIHFCTDLLFSERYADIAALMSDIVILARLWLEIALPTVSGISDSRSQSG